MSVQLIMETVNSCVIIALEVTGALVLLDTHWIQTIETVQVHTTVHINYQYQQNTIFKNAMFL